MSIPFSANQEVCNQRSGVYAIVNIKTEKFYIGSAVKLSRRKSEHLSDLRRGKHDNRHLQHSYNKHGEECFIFKVIEYVEDENKLLDIEDNWIKQYKPLGVTYNIREESSSNLGMKHSDEAKRKMSLVKQNMSDETKRKMSLAKQNMSDEARQRISELKPRKPVVRLDKNNNFVARFNSIIEAERETGINDSNIGDCCRGKQKSAGDYLWLYETDYLNGERPDKNNLINGHSKSILQFTKNNEFIKSFNSLTEASRETGINHGNISKCCLGKQKSSGGYIWQYESLYNQN